MKEFMIQVGTFMILGKTLLHFCPSEKYEKYIKLLFGFMIVIQFITPVLSLGNGNIMEEYINNQKVFEKKFEESLAEVEEKWFIYNEEIEKQIEKEQKRAEEMVQEKIVEQQSADLQNIEHKSEESERVSEEETQIESQKITETEAKQDKKQAIEIDDVKIEVSEHE